MPVKGMGVQVPPRTHRDHDLTCGYVIGQSLGKAGCDRFLQVRTMGVQIGFRSRNGNNSNGLQAAAPGRGGRRRAVQVKQRRRHATTVLLVITTRQRPPGPAPRTDTTSSITRTARRTSAATPRSAMAGSFRDHRPGVATTRRKLLWKHRSHRPFGIKKILPERTVALPSDQSQSARTCSACGPFWPCVMSNSTRWFSSRLR